MKYSSTLLLFAVLVSHAHTAPQLISFQDGKLGVSFGGYHAGIGIGGLLGNGTRGGLFAEAGTPTGQFATAGLGGSVGPHGISSGGLFAGATAGGNYHASAGLSGSTNTGNAIGSGFATAQGGNRITSSILGGLTGDKGSTGFTYSGAKEVEVVPLKSGINTELNVESVNEVQPIEKSQVEVTKTVIKEEIPPAVLVKEVHVEPQPQAVETHVVHTHYKPRRAHFRKTAFLGGYVGGQGEIVGPDPNPVVKTESEAERRVDVGVEAHAGAAADANVNGGVRKVYTKEVSVQRNPTFFRDIFDIPISTLKAVGNFLGNTASRTNISVQKSVHAGGYY